MISIAVLDDFPLIRIALVEAFRADGRLRVDAVCATAGSLLDALVLHEPHVAVLDLNVPDMAGIELIARVRRLHPTVRILVCTASERSTAVTSALDAGAHGYVVKRQEACEIANAVVAVHDGHVVIAPHVTAAMIHRRGADSTSGIRCEFTTPELEIIRRVVAGDTDEVIARALFVSPRTIQNRLTKLRRAAGVERRTDLVRWAIENQIA